MPDILKEHDDLFCKACLRKVDAFSMIYEREDYQELLRLNEAGLLVPRLKCGKCGSKNFVIHEFEWFYDRCPRCGGSGDASGGQGACPGCGGGGAY